MLGAYLTGFGLATALAVLLWSMLAKAPLLDGDERPVDEDRKP
jgi:hypothetical protein